jgi:hypothetical protein
MVAHVSLWGVLLGAVAAMIIGTIWYHQSVFGKPWMKAIGLTDKQMKARTNAAIGLLVVVSLVTAYMLSLFIIYYHAYVGGSWIADGFIVALFTWLGFGVTTILAHGVFEPRDRSVLYINIGNRLATLVAMGLIIGACLR